MAHHGITLPCPRAAESYEFLVEIGVGPSKSTVHKASCGSSLVAIKVIRLEKAKPDFETTTCILIADHPNILRPHCLFTVNRSLWVVMPFVSGGSLQSIVASSYPDGLPEEFIAAVLKPILTAISYLHDQGLFHRGVKAGNILIDSITGKVKLTDFGISAYARSPSSEVISAITHGSPYWMVPEVIYGFASDIWSFGITALELAYGRSPLSHLSATATTTTKSFSARFKNLVGLCLNTDPSKRPTARRLLTHEFFKNCKGPAFLVENMQQHNVPALEQRPKGNTRLKRKRLNDEGDDENENENDDDYAASGEIVERRRTAGWNFNWEGVHLVPIVDDEEIVDEEEEEEEEEVEEEKDDEAISAIAQVLIKSVEAMEKSIDEQMEKIIEACKSGDIYVPGTEEELTQKMLKEELDQVEVEMEKLKISYKK